MEFKNTPGQRGWLMSQKITHFPLKAITKKESCPISVSWSWTVVRAPVMMVADLTCSEPRPEAASSPSPF